MSDSPLRDSQLEMGRHLRDPERAPPPGGIEPRRLTVYRDLVYNNIESFISNGFPVLRRMYDDADWHDLVRAFVAGHHCRTPYFLEISQEFLQFLLEEHEPRDCDPPFLTELAHYEWVEMALDVSESEPPPSVVVADPLALVPCLSPVALVLSYRFEVHRIGPRYRPEAPGDPCYLAVWRGRDDRVRFMELNAMAARLLELVRDNAGQTGSDLLERLARESGRPPGSLRGYGAELLQQFLEQGLVGAGAG